MRRKKDSKNVIILALVLIVVILIVLLMVVVKNKDKKEENKKPNEKIVYLDKVKYNGLKVDKDVNKLITDYMDLYYQSISELKYYDMSNLFLDEEEAYKNETAINLLIESRKLFNYDMTLSNAKYSLNYTSYDVDDDTYKVELTEDGSYNFNFMKDITSKIYGVENTFIIVKTDDGFKIKKFDKVQDFYVMIDNKYEKDSDYKEELDRIKSDYITSIEEEIEDIKEQYEEYEDGYEINIEAENKYDRKKALEYAKKYVTKRNEDWVKYDEEGGNCQNYASQVLYAGGIPMDTEGFITEQWKHYSSVPNEEEVNEGRSYSWTGVGNFYIYAKTNKGFGLVAKANANLYSIEEGDIAQVGYDGYGHSAVVVGSIKDEEGKIIDLLVNSNTVDMENYPLQGYVYPNKRFIKIIGYNK